MTGPERLHPVAAKCWLTRCLIILMAWVMCWEMHLSYVFVTLSPDVLRLFSLMLIFNRSSQHRSSQNACTILHKDIRTSNHSRRCSFMTDSLKIVCFFGGCESLNCIHPTGTPSTMCLAFGPHHGTFDPPLHGVIVSLQALHDDHRVRREGHRRA